MSTMRPGEGTTPEQDPEYQEKVILRLARGEGVAAFVHNGQVLFFHHTLNGQGERNAHHPSVQIRVAQAIAVQQRAREQADHEAA